MENQEKKFVIKEAALAVLFEAVNTAHAGNTHGVINQFLQSQIEEIESDAKLEDEK